MNIQGKYIKYEDYVALEEKYADLSERMNLISDLMEYALRVFSQEQKKKEKPYAYIAMLVAILEAAEHRIAETDQRNAELTARIEPMDRRIAELEAKLSKPVLLPKTNGYWTEQEKAYEEAITLAKRQVRLAGFNVEEM